VILTFQLPIRSSFCWCTCICHSLLSCVVLTFPGFLKRRLMKSTFPAQLPATSALSYDLAQRIPTGWKRKRTDSSHIHLYRNRVVLRVASTQPLLFNPTITVLTTRLVLQAQLWSPTRQVLCTIESTSFPLPPQILFDRLRVAG
jgi:hypothetical protein